MLTLHVRYVLVGRSGGIMSGPTANREYLDEQVQHFSDSQVVPVFIHSSKMDENTAYDERVGTPLTIASGDEEAARVIYDALDEAGQAAIGGMVTQMSEVLNKMGADNDFCVEFIIRMGDKISGAS